MEKIKKGFEKAKKIVFNLLNNKKALLLFSFCLALVLVFSAYRSIK